MITDEEIEAPIKPIPELSFTMLDFMLFFRKAYRAEWATLVELYELFGSKKEIHCIARALRTVQ